MSGNAWEYCWDVYEAYTALSQTDPTGPDRRYSRIMQSGAFFYTEFYARPSFSGSAEPTEKKPGNGLRVARNAI